MQQQCPTPAKSGIHPMKTTSACNLSTADAIVQQLDAGLPVSDGYLYQRDARGATWLRRTYNSKPDVWAAKYCPTCGIWRPPRSHHCGECGVCMVRHSGKLKQQQHWKQQQWHWQGSCLLPSAQSLELPSTTWPSHCLLKAARRSACYVLWSSQRIVLADTRLQNFQ